MIELEAKPVSVSYIYIYKLIRKMKKKSFKKVNINCCFTDQLESNTGNGGLFDPEGICVCIIIDGAEAEAGIARFEPILSVRFSPREASNFLGSRPHLPWV